METVFEKLSHGADRIVYVRPVAVADLPAELQAAAEGASDLYALHNSQGERLAVVKDKRLAFWLARQNDLEPVQVQ
ncbi:MAG: DUF1150 family protein [Paracoccaceae bacterium]